MNAPTPAGMRASLILLAAFVVMAATSSPAYSSEPDGTLRFAPPVDYPAVMGTPGGSAAPLDTADFNRDGRPDLVAASTTGTGPSILFGAGQGRFQPAEAINSGADASVVATGDFNADRKPDIATGSYFQQRMTVLLGDGRGGFRRAANSAIGGIPTQFAVADFDRDGDQDIASSMYIGGTISLFLGNGDGTFQKRKAIPASLSSLSIAAVDLNKDRAPDLVVAETIPNRTIKSVLPGELNVLIGNGDGTFQPRQTYPVGLMPEDFATGDVDEDGNIDVVVANALTNDLSLMRGKGNGQFHTEQRIASGPKGVISLPLLEVEGAPGVRLADFDKDGHLDLAVIQTVRNRIAFSRGDGDGGFKLSAILPAPDFSEPFLALDLNGDRCTDIAIHGNHPPPLATTAIGKTRVSILINQSCRK